MKPKRKLKRWVKIVLLLLPQLVMILELFFICLNVKEIVEQPTVIVVNDGGAYCD